MAENGTEIRPPFARFWACASGFWKKARAVSWPLTIGMAVLTIIQITVQYRLNYWNRDFFNALERRDAHRLWEEAWLFVPLAATSIALSVAAVWCRMTTQRKWREWLTRHLLAMWLKDGHYRRLQFVTGEHQNAEYRISVDARLATDAPVDMVVAAFSAIIAAGVFTNVLWTAGGSMTFSVGGYQLTIPGYLVLGIAVYAFTFIGWTLVIGRRLPQVIQRQNQAEAEMLAATSRIRELGEEPAPEEHVRQRPVSLALRHVLERWRLLLWQLMGTTMVSQMDLLLAPVFAWVLCAPKYLNGTMTLGELTQASAAFVTLRTAFNWFVDNFQRVSDWRAATTRVAALLTALDQVEEGDYKMPPHTSREEQGP
jgi:vitamin B12/bleomycin/antimicrobial peptide transport system ATP-binding/permease protein